jgi:hypothetical protein
MHALEDSADVLTPYATEFRYPSEVMTPTLEEFREALSKAEEVLNVVMTLLPEPIREMLDQTPQPAKGEKNVTKDASRNT